LGDGCDDLVSLVALRSVSLPSWPPASPTGIGVELKNLGSTHNPAAVWLAGAPGLACTQVAMCVVRTIARLEARSKANADVQALRHPLWETPEATTAAIAVGQLADGPSDTLPSLPAAAHVRSPPPASRTATKKPPTSALALALALALDFDPAPKRAIFQTPQIATWVQAERRWRSVGRAAWMPREPPPAMDGGWRRAHGASPE
jgi:hypothetical protein